MSIWSRRTKVPAHTRSWLGPDERVLAFATTTHGDPLLATQRGIWMPDPAARPTAGGPGSPPDSQRSSANGENARSDGPPGVLLGWERIVEATWREDLLTLTPAEEVEDGIWRRLRALAFPLAESGDLPRTVRVRMDRTVAESTRRSLGTGGSALVVARRVAGQDGLLRYVVFDREADLGDPAATAAAHRLLAAVRGSAPAPD